MDIVPILQTFRHNKGALVLMVAQVAVTLAVLVNALVVIDAYRKRLNLDTGILDRRVVAVELEPVDQLYFDEPGRVRNDAQRHIDRLRQIPGVSGVSQVGWFPLSGDGPMRPSWPVGSAQEMAVRHSVFTGDAQFLETLGLRLIAGRDFRSEEVNWTGEDSQESRAPLVVISSDLAEMLFPGEDAVGKQIETDSGQVDTVIGVVEQLPGRHILMNTVRLGAVVPARSTISLRYALRTQRDVSPALLEQVSQTLLDGGADFDIRVDSLHSRKAESMHYLFLFGSILGTISVLLVLVTAIGAYSQAAYSVGKRIKQIGTRRAFGASRFHILRYFLMENWITTSLGLLVGMLIANAISFVLTQTMQLPKIEAGHLVLGALFLWSAGLLSTLLPATRAARVPPALATRLAR